MKFLWDYLSLKQFFIRLAIGYWLVIDWLNGYRKISLNANVMNLMQTRDFSFLVIVYEYVCVCVCVYMCPIVIISLMIIMMMMML